MCVRLSAVTVQGELASDEAGIDTSSTRVVVDSGSGTSDPESDGEDERYGGDDVVP